jgi:hypothetical protein
VPSPSPVDAAPAAPAVGLGLADLRWWTRRTAGPIAQRWPAVSRLTVGKDPARVARACRRRAVVFAGWNAVCVPLNAVLFGSALWVALAAEGAAQCALQWHLWRRHPEALEDRIRDRQRLAGEWLVRRGARTTRWRGPGPDRPGGPPRSG